jgi:hypothetical protein
MVVGMNARILSTVVGLLLLGAAAPASADTIWNLSVVPTDGVSLAGSFTTDAAGDLLSYDIAVVGGRYNGYRFDAAHVPVDHDILSGPQSYEIASGPAHIVLKFADPLSAGLSKDTFSSWDFDYLDVRQNSASGTMGYVAQLPQVPEPSSLAMLGSALAGFAGFVAFRRRKHAAV